MKIQVGHTYLVTTSEWFLAPDGCQYRAAFGTVLGIYNDTETLGIATNRNSTNWYVQIGGLSIAGCQVRYAIRTDNCVLDPVTDVALVDGEAKSHVRPSMIYRAGVGTAEG